MLDHPGYILSGLDLTGMWSPEQAEDYLKAFRAAWGDLDVTSLRRALHEGGDQDRLFALHALGATRSAEARDQLVPFLTSEHPLERWASAIELGQMRVERALPVLWQILTEFLPPDAEYHTSEYYRAWRGLAPAILGEWGKPESVPALRSGLQATLQVELAVQTADTDPGYWAVYEYAIVYALGRLGGFGALAGIAGSDAPLTRYPGPHDYLPQASHLEQWRIHLIMGTLHQRYQIGGNWTWQDTPALLEEVTRMLEHIFGITAEMAAPAMRRYEAEMGFDLAYQYGWMPRPAEHLEA